MRSLYLCFVVVIVFGTGTVFGQGGGKAEPNRIKFEIGKFNARLTGTLKSGQEMEYLFGATKGQVVTIRNPTFRTFDFRVFSEENFSEGDFDSSPTYTFEIPETGEYMLFIRKKVAGPRRARFSVTLTIK